MDSVPGGSRDRNHGVRENSEIKKRIKVLDRKYRSCHNEGIGGKKVSREEIVTTITTTIVKEKNKMYNQKAVRTLFVDEQLAVLQKQVMEAFDMLRMHEPRVYFDLLDSVVVELRDMADYLTELKAYSVLAKVITASELILEGYIRMSSIDQEYKYEIVEQLEEAKSNVYEERIYNVN